MTWSDRVGRNGDRTGGRGAVLLAIVLLVAIVALSGLLAPAGPVDVSFPLIGSDGGDATNGGGADGPAATVSDGTLDQGETGLRAQIESELGEQALERDLDGDGYAAGMELDCERKLPESHPYRQDIYVEVDSAEGVSLSDGAIERIEEAFASAPVTNEHGERGLDVHLVRSDDDLPDRGPVDNRKAPGEYNDIADYRDDYFDNEGLGYHYLLVVPDAAYNGDPSYAGAGHRGNAVVEHYDRDEVMASLIMHELGHAFGITHRNEGVDDENYSLEEYESVMSYNGIYETMTYSDGTDDLGRDEWGFVTEDRHKPELDCPDGNCTAVCSGGD